ncbi:MAG TPA: response regulator [Chloroflexota bacterium]|jgi:DNA-binding response OmpR family regulator|nr:response regulator [Chloroflexota bacterium]
MPATVLVVDDDALLRHVLAEALELEGYEVEQAGDGQTAFERIRRRCPDALVLNNVLPVLTGYDLIVRLRDERIDLPVLLISGAPRPLDIVPPGSFLAKPFDLLVMLDWVKAAVDHTGVG